MRCLLSFVLTGLVYLYRYGLRPFLKIIYPHNLCRFSPSCSEYFLQAVKTHGPYYGTWLGIKRISRCHPWGGHGHDPVPPHHCSHKK